MAQQHRDDREPNAQDSPQQDAVTLPSAYDVLMKQHTEAVLRIHTLETENQNLLNLLKQTLSGNAPPTSEQTADAGDLLARVQALESQSQSQPATAPTASVPPPPSVAVDDEVPGSATREIEQLRVLNQSLVGRVSRLDDQLQELKAERRRPRRRRSSDRGKLKSITRLFKR